MKVLVLGSSGFLGSYLGYALPSLGHEVFGVSRRDVPYFANNRVVEGLDQFTEIIRSGDFDTVINCVAVASHEACQADPENAQAVNATFPAVWALAAAGAGVRFVHISSDAVFDGASAELYSETDATNPETVYGITKLQAEHKVLAANPDAMVLRTNFFGWSQNQRTGILDFFVKSFADQSSITGFQDYVVSSLYMGDLVDAIVSLVEGVASDVFHTVSSTPLSKYDFGQMVAIAVGLSADSMTAGFLSDEPGLAPRGHNLALSTAKIEHVLGRTMPSTQAGIQRALSERDALIDYFGGSER